MSDFTAKKLKETRNNIGFSLDEVAERMHISRRRLIYIESGEREVTSDEIVEFAKLYKVDVRELLLESYAEESEEQILCNRYISLYERKPRRISDERRSQLQKIMGNINKL